MLVPRGARLIPIEEAAAVSTLRLSLPQSASSPTEARHELASFMRDHGLCADPTTALLIVSELVTNAVTHGIEPIELLVSDTDGDLRIEVSDGDTLTARPTPQNPNADHVGGRGAFGSSTRWRGIGV